MLRYAMRFRVNSDLHYDLNGPATFFFALKCIETGGQHLVSESLITEPETSVEEFTLGTGMNRFTRIRTEQNGPFRVKYSAEVETQVKVISTESLKVDGPGKLAPEAIPFLFPSRYCQSDRLRQEAMDLFGHLTNPHDLAAGIRDWIYDHIAYRAGTSNEQSSAVDTWEQRQGVCRDFAHLGIAFCRAMNVPARYVSCYSYQLDPPDFHACYEVFIDGWWYIFDATRLAPLNGLVRIATGRDAADAAVCSIFGNPQMKQISVSCECLDEGFMPITGRDLANENQAMALL